MRAMGTVPGVIEFKEREAYGQIYMVGARGKVICPGHIG